MSKTSTDSESDRTLDEELSQISTDSESDRTLDEELSRSSTDSEDDRTLAQELTKEELVAKMKSLKWKLKRQRRKRLKERKGADTKKRALKKRAKNAEISLAAVKSEVQQSLGGGAEHKKTTGPVRDFNIDELRKWPVIEFEDFFEAGYYEKLNATDQLEYNKQEERFEETTLDQKITSNYLLNKHDCISEEIGEDHPLHGSTRIRIVKLVLSVVLRMKRVLECGCVVGDGKTRPGIKQEMGDHRFNTSVARIIIGLLFGFNKLIGLETPHLCANDLCLNITHLCLESNPVNASRKFCHGRGFTGNNGLCTNDVKCMQAFDLVIPDEAESYELCKIAKSIGSCPNYEPVDTFAEASHIFFRGATYGLKGTPINQCTKSTSRSTGKLTCSSKITIFGPTATATAHTCDLSKIKAEDLLKSLADSKVMISSLKNAPPEAEPYTFVSNSQNRLKYEPVDEESDATHYVFKKAMYLIKGGRPRKCINRVGTERYRCESTITIFGPTATATAHTCDLSKIKPNESKEAESSATKRGAHDVEFGPVIKKSG